MNAEEIKGNWNQLKGHIRKQWGELTDDQVDQIEGNRDILIGKIQECYGISKEEAEHQVSTFNSNL